jgi:hypothetical protein
MELRPELMPPEHDCDLVSRLAKLADRLDGASDGDCDAELAEFNRLAGTALPLCEFQGIYKGVNPEDFVRDVLNQQATKPVNDLSRAEMVEIVSRVLACGPDHDFYSSLFEMYCKHPASSDLIFYPENVPEMPKGRVPTAEEIADCALSWEPRVVAMRIKQRGGGTHVPYYIYTLEAPDTPETQVVTSVDTPYPKGAVVAVALNGVKLDDGTVVTTSFEFRVFSCGKILGLTDQPVGARIR